jgi:hypothetical protein
MQPCHSSKTSLFQKPGVEESQDITQENLDDLIDVLVGRVLDSIGVENNLYPRWKGNAYNGSDQSGMR